jgi:hypothetical protein
MEPGGEEIRVQVRERERSRIDDKDSIEDKINTTTQEG